MQFITSKVHGILDYVVGFALFVSPWVFGFEDNIVARWVAIVCALTIVAYSLITNYELGAWRIVNFNVHRWFDIFIGAVLVVAPWFFGFSEETRWPFVAFGLLGIVVPLLSRHYPYGLDEQTYTDNSEYEPPYPTENPIV